MYESPPLRECGRYLVFVLAVKRARHISIKCSRNYIAVVATAPLWGQEKVQSMIPYTVFAADQADKDAIVNARLQADGFCKDDYDYFIYDDAEDALIAVAKKRDSRLVGTAMFGQGIKLESKSLQGFLEQLREIDIDLFGDS